MCRKVLKSIYQNISSQNCNNLYQLSEYTSFNALVKIIIDCLHTHRIWACKNSALFYGFVIASSRRVTIDGPASW